jgi:hypothetical protein
MTSYVSPFTGDVIQPTDVSYQAYTLSADLQLQWPSNTSTIDNPAARIMDVIANSSGLNLIMPPANQVSVGQDALIRNLGSNTFTVLDYSSGTIVSVPAGEAKYIYVTTNNTEAGTWGVIDFGAGTSGGNASELAGLGLLAISSTLNQSHPAISLTNGHTFNSADRAQTNIWNGGVGAVTLPLASTLGNNWFTIFKNNGSGTLTINTSGSDTLDQQPQKTFQPDDSSIIICDGSNYVTVGYGQSPNFLFTALVKPVTSGTYILTYQEASSIIQEYVGSLTGNVIVQYPPVVALYIISNQTVPNGHSLTITTGVGGGTNASIPSGQQATLVCDGTNFFNANTVQAGATSINLVDGTEAVPALSFATEITTGIYRPAAGNFGISILGSEVLNIDGNGIEVTGTGTFSGGILGGTF